MHSVHLFTTPYYGQSPYCTKILGFRGFDSSIILILRGGILMSIGSFPEMSSQQILEGISFDVSACFLDLRCIYICISAALLFITDLLPAIACPASPTLLASVVFKIPDIIPIQINPISCPWGISRRCRVNNIIISFVYFFVYTIYIYIYIYTCLLVYTIPGAP